MLQQLAHIILVSIVCIIWGVPILLIWQRIIDRDNFWYRSFAAKLSFLFFCGCITISLLSSLLSLIAPLHFLHLAILSLVISGYLIFFRGNTVKLIFGITPKRTVSFNWVNGIFILVTIFVFLLLSSLQPVNGDTQLYHLQVIRWQHEYGTVPGIVNLYPRLGLNSNWLNLISWFYLPFLKNENFTYLNAAFVMWFFVWLFSAWHFHLKQTGASKSSRTLACFYFLFLIYGLFDWQLFRDAANSTNFDFPVNAFLFIIFSYFIEGIVTGNKLSFSLPLLLFCFALLGFKFSGIFIFILVIYYLFSLRSLSNWITTALTGLLFLSPVVLRNYITTGYPFFPVTVAVSTPDWQFPTEMAQRFYSYILLSNKFYNHRLSFAFSHHTSTWDWIPYWWQGILVKHKIVLALALSSLAFLFAKRSIVAEYSRLKHLIIVLMLMIAGWFFTAPDPGRFGYGMLLTTAFLCVSVFAGALLHPRLYQGILIITTIAMCYYLFQKSRDLHFAQYSNTPISNQTPGYSVLESGDVELHLPNKVGDNSDYRCYFTPLPCITQDNPYLEPRGKTINKGFRMRPITDSSFILNYNY
jgi:hypothetical protein